MAWLQVRLQGGLFLLRMEDLDTPRVVEDNAVPFLSAEPAAYLATIGELVLPVLLILGLFTRFSAAGLFVMTLVIQIWVLPLDLHYVWMAALALLVGYGGDKFSLDKLLLKDKH